MQLNAELMQPSLLKHMLQHGRVFLFGLRNMWGPERNARQRVEPLVVSSVMVCQVRHADQFQGLQGRGMVDILKPLVSRVCCDKMMLYLWRPLNMAMTHEGNHGVVSSCDSRPVVCSLHSCSYCAVITFLI